MQMYVKRVQGSAIEHKGSAITWNYREVGAAQLAKEMAQELTLFLDPEQPDGLLRGYPVTVSAGKGYVEVRRMDINKGIAVRRVLDDMRRQYDTVDFILCIGDDRSDEDMFETIANVKKDPSYFGDRPTRAGAGLARIPSAGCLSSVVRGSGTSLAELDDVAQYEQSPQLSPKLGTNKAVFDTWDKEADQSRKVKSGFGEMFMTVEEVDRVPAPTKASKTSFYSITVGRKPSSADYFVKDPEEVSDLLQKLAMQSTKANMSRYASAPNLAQMALGSCDSDEEEDVQMGVSSPLFQMSQVQQQASNVHVSLKRAVTPGFEADMNLTM